MPYNTTGDFYDYVDVRWATVAQTPQRLLHVDQLEGLRAKLGRNVDQVLGPEEVLAESFALAIDPGEQAPPRTAVAQLNIIRGRKHQPRAWRADDDEAAKKALREAFESWLDAQNRLDFEAYSALYSERFVGVKRLGTRNYLMNRTTWLADQAPKFQRPMTLAAQEPVFTVRGNAGMIHLETKRIEMARELGNWRIATEVELHTSLQRSEPTTEPSEFAFVADLAQPYAMLDVVARKGLRVDTRTRTLERHQQGFSVIAAIPQGAAPGHARRWVGRNVRVITDTGSLCPGRIVDDLRYVARVVPHHREADYFQGFVDRWGDEARPPKAPPDAEILEAIWQSTHEVFVGARIKLEDGCYGEALVVQPASTPVPRVAAALESTPRAEALLAAFRALPEYAQEQRNCVARNLCADGQSWEQPTSSLHAFRFEGSTEVLASVAQFHRGCSAYSPHLWTVFTLSEGDENAPIAVRAKPTTIAPFRIELMLDRTGNGVVEYVVNDGQWGHSLINADGETQYSWALDFQAPEC